MKCLFIFTLFLSQLAMAQNTTTVYLIRHAEKADASQNPDLSAAGLQRAKHWNEIFASVTFDAIYSTQYNRTQQTAKPTAEAQNIKVIAYEPKTLTAEKIKTTHAGQTILVVGHSNTIPDLANQLIGQNIYPMMDESVFGNLYLITINHDTISHQLLKSL